MFCSKCGAALSESDQFCSKCGSPVAQKPQKRYCTVCGAELAEDQLFCTKCGMRFDESTVRQNNTYSAGQNGVNASAGISPDTFIKGYANKSYSVGKLTLGNVKQCSIVMRGDRLEILKNGKAAYLLGGALGGAIMGSVEGAIAAKGNSGKPATVTIPYRSIRAMEKGKFGLNNTIVFTMADGAVYTIAVGYDQDEIINTIRSKM